MSSTCPPEDDLYGPVEVRFAGRKYRDQYAAIKPPEYAEWILDECPYLEEGTPLLPYPCVSAFVEWARARSYEVRVPGRIWSRVESFDGETV